MKKSLLIVVSAVAALGSSALGATTFFETSALRAGVVGWAGNPPSVQYPYLGPQVEHIGTGGFGFPTRAPDASRLIADGVITRRDTTGDTLLSISAGVGTNDADLFQIEVTDPTTFSARVGGFFSSGAFAGQQSGSASSLFIFDEAGNAIRGGTARLDWTVANNGTAENDAKNVVITLPAGATAGKYWLGVSANVNSAFNATVNGNAPIDVIVPRNNAGVKLFDESLLLANPGTVYDALALADQKLSTDRLTSWQVTPFDDGTIANPALATVFLPNGQVSSVGVDFTTATTGFPASVSIVLTGANYAVPEPVSMLSVAGLATLVLRRNRRA